MAKIYLRRLGDNKPLKTLTRKEISARKIIDIVNRYKIGLFKIKQKGIYVSPSNIQNNFNTHIIEVMKRRKR